MKDYDIIIIGAGVSGCAIARELSKYEVKCLVLDKEELCVAFKLSPNGYQMHLRN